MYRNSQAGQRTEPLNCSFTLQHYKECIELARDKGYYFIRASDYKDQDEKIILMRHDIDLSLEHAYELANIEYDLGIFSNYYVYLHSPTYNALSPKSMGMIKAIQGMGHEIGVHVDSRYYIDDELYLNDICRIPDDGSFYVKTWTRHLPGITPEESNPTLLNDEYMTNPNSFKLKYISDSGRNWREGCMCKHIGKESLHILVHPEWWFAGKNRTEALEELTNRFKKTVDRDMLDYKKMLAEYVRDLQ